MEIAAALGLLRSIAEVIQKLFAWKTAKKREEELTHAQEDGKALLKRFLRVFESQGVPRPLIPRFAALEGRISIPQACSDLELAKVLDDAVLKHVATRFGISSAWLYGTSSDPHDFDSSYKDPEGALERLVECLEEARREGGELDELLFIANKAPSAKDQAHWPSDPQIIVLARLKLDQIEGMDVERVVVFEDDLPWNHAPARLYAKQITFLAMALGIHVRGTLQSDAKFDAFFNGHLFAHELISMGASWHPDDFVVSHERSPMAKHIDEAVLVRQSISSSMLERASSVCAKMKRRSHLDLLLA